MPIIDLNHVIEDQRLAVGEEIEEVIGDAIGPGRRTVVGVSRALHHAERHLDAGDRSLLLRRQCRGDVVAVRIEIFERLGGRERRAHDRPIGQIDVREGHVPGDGVESLVAGPDLLDHGAARRRDRRLVVGPRDRDGDRDEGDFVVGVEIVVDADHVGQGQRLAGGEEVEQFVGHRVGPDRRAVVVVVAVGDDVDLDLGRRDVLLLQVGERGGDVLLAGALVDVVRRTGEVHLHRRPVALVEVEEGDPAGHLVRRNIAGLVGLLGQGERRLDVAVEIEAARLGRPGNAAAGRRVIGRRRRHTARLVEIDEGWDRDVARRGLDHQAVAGLRDRVGEVGGQLGVAVVVRELQREHVRDQLLDIGRHQRIGDRDVAAADLDHLAGLVDRRDRQQRDLVEQDVGAGGAVRLDQHLEARLRLRIAAAGRNDEIDLGQHRRAADAHGGNRRIDLHVAVLGGLAGNEGNGARDQAEQRGIVRPVGVVHHLVQHHPRIGGQAEHSAIDEGDAKRRIGAGRDDVALLDIVAIVQDDRDAVADRGRAAGQLGDVADDLRRGGAGCGLRVLDMARQRVDDVAGEVGAVGRGDRRALVAPEIIMNDELVTVMGQHEVAACALEVAVEDQVGVGNDERAVGHVAMPLGDEGLGGKGIGIAVAGRARALAIQEGCSVKFASVIQPATIKRVKM